jgi:hypothetical protein
VPKKISLSTILLIISACSALLAQESGMPATIPQGRQSTRPLPNKNATNATGPPVGKDGKVLTNDLAVTKITDQASPQLGPAAKKGKAIHPAVSLSPSAVAAKKAENASAQTVSIGASRAEGAGNQSTKLGTPRAENAPDQTNQVGASRHQAKTATITPPANAIQAGPDTPKKKKPAAPPHRP